jgi:hypothetical protein
MSRENINNGTSANDGSGDSLRNAATKINNNFRELYQAIGGDSAAIQSYAPKADSDTLAFGNIFNGNKVYLKSEPDHTATVFLLDSDCTLLGDTSTQNVTNKTISESTLDSCTINYPVISNAIYSGATREIIKFTDTASAVNEVTITNAATGNKPSISSTGNDTNISLSLSGKGTGAVNVSSPLSYNIQANADGTPSFTAPVMTTGVNITLQNGTNAGQVGIIIATASVGVQFANGPSQINLAADSAIQVVWTGSKWVKIQ